jgi:hypothetical protein
MHYHGALQYFVVMILHNVLAVHLSADITHSVLAAVLACGYDSAFRIGYGIDLWL